MVEKIYANINNKEVVIENICASKYRLKIDNVIIIFDCEWRKGGNYFKIQSLYDDVKNKCYVAQRYFYKYILYIREAAFLIFKHNGLYDYKENKFHFYEEERKLRNCC